jgi:hypothetical protein
LRQSAIEQLNKDFDTLLAADKIVQGAALPEEANDTHLARVSPHRLDASQA